MTANHGEFHMKLAMLIAAGLLASNTAFAADAVEEVPMMEAPAVGEWTGFYAGIQLGYGFGSTGELQLSGFADNPALQTAFTPVGLPGGSAYTGEGDFEDGFVGGVHIGYDVQMSNWVVGGVLDVNYTDVGDGQRAFSRTPARYEITRELDYLITARARLGYLVTPTTLAYATGGVAYGDVDFSYEQPGSAATFTTAGGQDSDIGYTVGAGVETKVSERITIGVEYLYTNLGGNDFAATLTGGPFSGVTPTTDLTTGDDDFDFHTISLKMSYRF